MLKETLTKKSSSSSNEVSITPTGRHASSSSKKPNSVSASITGPGGIINWPSSVSVSSASPSSSKARPTLRPKRPGHVACSIHCAGVSGFPTLSCAQCHSLFHPICVGLMDGMTYSMYDFYCNDCGGGLSDKPTKEKENSVPTTTKKVDEKKPTLNISRSTSGSNNGTGNSSVSGNTAANRGHGPGYSQGVSSQSQGGSGQRKPQPLRPIESQSVINIAGNKYLVVPVPPNNQQQQNNKNKATTTTTTTQKNNLPLLLKPAENGSLPSFQVEETSDGKLMLLPTTNHKSGLDKILKRKKEEAISEKCLVDKSSKRFCNFLTSNLTGAYFAMIQVFQYLTAQERLQAARVCRLWRDLSYHPSLWKTISLKVKIRIHNIL